MVTLLPLPLPEAKCGRLQIQTLTRMPRISSCHAYPGLCHEAGTASEYRHAFGGGI
jgi:hypothetical protein